MSASAINQQPNQLEQWNAWSTQQRPRIVRLRCPFWCAVLFVSCLAVPCLVIAFLIKVLPDLWSALPFILLLVIFLVVAFWILMAHRRLVRTGEISLAKVIGVRLRRRGPAITYEFSDLSGRLITASSPDDSRTLSVGMVIPVFYNPENPQKGQVALCGSFYEVSDVPARQGPD